MAVYTHVSAKDLSAFLADYSIGEALTFKGIAEGVENSNYLLETQTTRAILTLYEKRANPEDLPYYLDIMTHLAAAGLKSPLPIQDNSGKALKTLLGKPACLISFLSGVSCETPTAAQAENLGRALADMHMALADFDQINPNPLGLDSWADMLAATKDKAQDAFADLHQALTQELTFLKGAWPTDLPKGTIHADLFPDNVLFIDDTVTGLIDFYFSCYDQLAYDLAVCLTAWCFDADQQFQPDLAAAMMRGYNAMRPLSAAELDALAILCRGACMRFTLTRLVDWFVSKGDAVVNKKSPEAYFKRLTYFQSHKDFLHD